MRRVCLIAFITVLAFAFSSCGVHDPMQGAEGALQDAGEEITLQLWHIWATDSDSNREPFQKALGQWQAQNPHIRIEVEATENETYKLKIRTAIAANEAPDIFFCWGAGFAEPFVDAGKVLALDPYLTDGTLNKLVPGTLENFTYDGRVYALPIFIIVGVLYCNEELFDQYRVQIPDTYEELLTAVAAFSAKGIVPITVGEKDGWPGIMYQNILAIRTAGVDLCNAALNKQASFDQPAFVQSAERLRELIEAGAFDPRCMQLTAFEAEQRFKQGQAAMYYIGSWASGSLDRDDCPVQGKVIVRNFPILEGAAGDQNGYVGGAIDTFMVSANTPYKDEAVRVLKEIDESLCRESYLSGAGIPAWNTCLDETSASPLTQEILRLIEDRDGFVLAWDTVLTGTKAQTHIDLVTGLFAGTCTPEQFAAEMQRLNE